MGWRRRFGNQAHPRVSGENAGCKRIRARERGSSPRERGKHYLRPTLVGCIGLIPA